MIVGTAIWMLVEFVAEAGGLVSTWEVSDDVTLQVAPQMIKNFVEVLCCLLFGVW